MTFENLADALKPMLTLVSKLPLNLSPDLFLQLGNNDVVGASAPDDKMVSHLQHLLVKSVVSFFGHLPLALST